MVGPSVTYAAYIVNPPRGTRTRGRSRSVSGISKVSDHPNKSFLLGSGSVFVISKERYIVTNFHVMKRAYNMTLLLEELNTYAVEFFTLPITSWERDPFFNKVVFKVVIVMVKVFVRLPFLV